MVTDIQEFFETYETELALRPGLRLGQTAFNTLYTVHPRLANRVRGSLHDPFNNDNRLPEFFEFIRSHWDEVPGS